MHHVQDMLRTHPAQSHVEMSVLAACIEACYDCAQTCTTCADGCLGEDMVAGLVR